MPKTTKEKWPKHKMGKTCGYEEYEDGSIEVAPMHGNSMESARQNRVAVDDLLRAVTRQCHELLKQAVKTDAQFWKSLSEDYGLDMERYEYSYNYENRRVYRKEKVKVEQPTD